MDGVIGPITAAGKGILGNQRAGSSTALKKGFPGLEGSDTVTSVDDGDDGTGVKLKRARYLGTRQINA